MIKTNLSTYILSFNRKTMNYEILSTHPQEFHPPSQEIIANIDIQKNLYDLVSKYINVEKDIFGYTFLDINIDNEINIIYFITIPYDFPKKDLHFVSINNTSNEFYIKNIQKIINRI